MKKQTATPKTLTRKRPSWIAPSTKMEDDLCPDCFKVVGVKSRYKLVCLLGKSKNGVTVGTLTDELGLKQPTITHHLNILKSVDAVDVRDSGRERIYTLNRGAHCFDECQIPY
jgi:DNA-binding transcriptional ArsR family regulator